MSDRRPRISVVATAVAKDLRAAPKAARLLGFAGLQLPLSFAGVDLSQLSGTGIRDVRHLLSAQEQEPVAISVDLGPKGMGPGADIDRVLKRLTDAMQAAHALMAGVLTVDLGPLPQPAEPEKPVNKVPPASAGLILLPTAAEIAAVTRPAGPPPTTDGGFFSKVDAALLELGRTADRIGVTIALRTDLSSFAALERALKAADCPWFGVDMDPVALLRDAWPPDEVFSRLGPLIRHVRVRDAIGGAGGRTRPAAVGQGDTNWPELQSLLGAADYDGWFTVDPTELPDRVSGATAARSVLSKTAG